MVYITVGAFKLMLLLVLLMSLAEGDDGVEAEGAPDTVKAKKARAGQRRIGKKRHKKGRRAEKGASSVEVTPEKKEATAVEKVELAPGREDLDPRKEEQGASAVEEPAAEEQSSRVVKESAHEESSIDMEQTSPGEESSAVAEESVLDEEISRVAEEKVHEESSIDVEEKVHEESSIDVEASSREGQSVSDRDERAVAENEDAGDVGVASEEQSLVDEVALGESAEKEANPEMEISEEAVERVSSEEVRDSTVEGGGEEPGKDESFTATRESVMETVKPSDLDDDDEDDAKSESEQPTIGQEDDSTNEEQTDIVGPSDGQESEAPHVESDVEGEMVDGDRKDVEAVKGDNEREDTLEESGVVESVSSAFNDAESVVDDEDVSSKHEDERQSATHAKPPDSDTVKDVKGSDLTTEIATSFVSDEHESLIDDTSEPNSEYVTEEASVNPNNEDGTQATDTTLGQEQERANEAPTTKEQDIPIDDPENEFDDEPVDNIEVTQSQILSPATKLENPVIANETCTAPNTKIDKHGKCVCLKGFHGDTPVTSRGCWKCKSRCDVDANCVYPGECVCNGGLVGDGVTACRIPKPVMKSVSPTTGDSNVVVTISYSVATPFKPHTGYCLFGSSITPATIIDEHILTCEVPVDCHGLQQLRISFDSLRWSDEHFDFKITRRSSDLKDLPWPIIGFAAVCVLVIIVFGCSARQTEDNHPESPLLDHYASQKAGFQSGHKRTKPHPEQPRKRAVSPA